MTAISLFDALTRSRAASGEQQDIAQVARFAAKLVESSLGEWQQVLEYEKQFGCMTFSTPAEEMEINRCLFDMYKKWAAEAEDVLARTRALAASGQLVNGVAELEDAHCRVLARLKLSPDMLSRASEQVRQGQAVPMKELRDELRARIRA